ncbi:MAG TPA: glycoside hydrolase family 15 protein [Polyangiaceae bacterium]
MRRRAAAHGVLVALGVFLGCEASARADAVAHRSEAFLPSSNGNAAIAWDRTQYKLVQFLEHPYASASAGTQTRNFAFDSYPGVRIGSAGTWLDAVAPVVVEYVPGTGIVHAVRSFGGVEVDEYHFAPVGLAEHASVMLLAVTGAGASAAVDAYALFNYHLGSGAPQPGADAESIAFDAARDAYYESGPSGVAFGYASVAPSAHHGCTPNNPYGLLMSGFNLADDAGTGGPTTDAVAGLQSALGVLPAGGSAWAGWVTVLAPDANASAAVDRIRAWVGGRAPAQLLSDEKSAWQSWAKPAPAGSSALESALAAQSQVVLRMGQVQEPGPGAGQILASVAPGQWNIAWVRDMAYATVGLVRSGHYAEAKAAIAFQMQAQVGAYQQYVGAPYQISVVRYYGDGSEWSDSNQDGPNVEFDGFGLFLWELDEYVRASGDTASLAQWWPAAKARVADALVALQEPSGLIKADSSIWEVHWNGQQRHFAYTTIAAATGLCAASHLAQAAGDASSVAGYLSAGQKARDAVLASLRAPDGTIVQSTEALAKGAGWLDAAALEAIGLGLVDPGRRTARATIRSIENGLVPQSGHGFMRSDAGDAYSSQEWVFVDLRAARALDLRGDAAGSAGLLSWSVAQASDNFGELSELHDAVTADYAGQSPMVGFGAGAYLLALFDRGKAPSPACGTFAAEPADPTDGGLDASGDDGGAIDAAPGGDAAGDDAGGANPDAPPGSGGGCGCALARAETDAGALLVVFPLALLAWRRRRS